MKELNDTESTNPTACAIAFAFSILVGVGLGYWAYCLDPDGTGASIRIFPVIFIMLPLSFAFFVTGLITRETIGWVFVLGALLVPAVFLISTNILRALLI